MYTKWRYKMNSYTTANSIRDIYSEKAIEPYLKIFYSEGLMQFIPEELRSVPLEEVEQKLVFPWGLPFNAQDLLHAAALAQDLAYGSEYELIPLWQRESKDYIPDVTKNDDSSVFLMRKKSVSNRLRPAAVICPGGGYETLSFDMEGIAFAEKLEEHGYAAFILNYRLAPNRYPAQQYDLMLAVKMIRANAKRFCIDPGRVLAIGSSAGGHLCASTAYLCGELEQDLENEIKIRNLPAAQEYCMHSGKPDALCLNYPVISFMDETHEPSFQALTGGDESLRSKLSAEQHIDSSYPRTFLWTCEDDSLVPPSNTKRMRAALEKAGITSCCILFPEGEHGCGLGTGTSAEGWIDRMMRFFEN